MAPPLSLDNLFTPATADEWNDEELTIADTLGLPTTTWQPGAVERTIFATVANIQQESDVAASIINQARFLDFAATGSVTYTTAAGETVTTLVTPDPSIPAQNPTGALGWLDVLSDSVYNVQRIIQSSAGGTLSILNTSASTYGPFVAGTYRVTQPGATGSPGYTNAAPVTISPSTLAGSITAPGCTSAGGIVKVHLVGHPFATGAPVFITGALGTTEANGGWIVTYVDADNFTLDGSTFTNAWSSGGTVYAPDTALFTADVPGTVSNATAPNVVNLAVTSLIGISVGNTGEWLGSDTEGNVALAARCRLKLSSLAIGGPGGLYVYYALVAQELAPGLTPPLVVAANVTRAIGVLDTTMGFVALTIANAAGGSGTSDVAAVQAVEDAYAGITGFTCVVQGAVNNTITIVLTVYLPIAYNTTTNTAYFKTAVQDYVNSLPIGGVTLPGGTSPNTNVVPYDGVIGSVFAAAALAKIPLNTGDVEGTLNGARLNVALATSPVPEVAVPSVAVVLQSV